MEHLSVRLRLVFKTAFHTTGNRRRWGADKALARSPHNRFVIPATTLKGVLRDRAEALLRAAGHRVCMAPSPETMCADVASLCLPCQIFGNPRRPSALRFSDCLLGNVPTQIRTGVSVSRHRRAALPHRLFFLETTDPALPNCVVSCDGFFPDVDVAYRAAALVSLAARGLSAIGAARTRGLGWIERAETTASLNGAEIPREKIESIWGQWLGGGNVGKD